MARKKKRGVKLTSKMGVQKRKVSVTPKRNKSESDVSIQEISVVEDASTSLSPKEKPNSGKKSCPALDTVGNENILSADFIPITSKFKTPCLRTTSNSVSSSAVNSSPPITITVDDNDNDSDSVDEVEPGVSDDPFNGSIQIVKEANTSANENSYLGTKDKAATNAATCKPRKRKFDDSIEILETHLSGPVKKHRKIIDLECSSAISSTVTSDVQGADDDIVVVDAIDNSRDSVKIMGDCVPIKIISSRRGEKRRRKGMMRKNRNALLKEQREEGNSNNVHSLFFQDKCGNSQGASACYKSPIASIANEDSDPNISYHNVYGNNVYNPNGVQKTGLRPVVIDGSNVAYGHGGKTFSARGIEICVNYFVKRGHWVVAFVPLFRRSEVSEADRKILDNLKDKQQLAFTPSRYLHHRRVTSYDDRFIVQCAAELGGIVVSTDNYRDLVCENEAWRETIERRLLMFTWVGDLLMFPDDPNGRGGPRLQEFLRFPQ